MGLVVPLLLGSVSGLLGCQFDFRLTATFHICRKCFGKFVTDLLFLLFLVHVSVRSEDG